MGINNKDDLKGMRLLLAGLAMQSLMPLIHLPLAASDVELITDTSVKVADALIAKVMKE